MVQFAAVALGSPARPEPGQAPWWFKRLAPVLESDAFWTLKPCELSREDLRQLQETPQRDAGSPPGRGPQLRRRRRRPPTPPTTSKSKPPPASTSPPTPLKSKADRGTVISDQSAVISDQLPTGPVSAPKARTARARGGAKRNPGKPRKNHTRPNGADQRPNRLRYGLPHLRPSASSPVETPVFCGAICGAQPLQFQICHLPWHRGPSLRAHQLIEIPLNERFASK